MTGSFRDCQSFYQSVWNISLVVSLFQFYTLLKIKLKVFFGPDWSQIKASKFSNIFVIILLGTDCFSDNTNTYVNKHLAPSTHAHEYELFARHEANNDGHPGLDHRQPNSRRRSARRNASNKLSAAMAATNRTRELMEMSGARLANGWGVVEGEWSTRKTCIGNFMLG